jgi:molybdopterin/thiamine biosynthesis adenylyltransferase
MTTLVLTGEMAARLRELAALDIETGAVLLARRAGDRTDLRLLGFEMHEVPEHAYERREAQQLLITSDGYVPALARAEETGCIPIWLHTHPGAGSCPESSRHDRVVDQQLSDLFRLRADSAYYGALIVSIDGSNLTFTGHLDDGDSRSEIDRLLVVGDRLAVHARYQIQLDPIPDLFDRHVRAFGGDVQRALGSLNVAVVGCGGTGSAVAEQLVRLGVRHLRLVDPDVLSASNVTRVYGSTAADVDRPKVDVLAEHLARIAPDVQVDTMPSMLTVEATARAVSRADVVFGCTDDNAGRLVLSRLSTYMSILVIDCGVILSSNGGGTLDGIHGRVTTLSPGSACLVCRNRIDTARAASELLTPEERVRLVDEGYAPALAGIEPAVITFTTAVAAAAVSELLERLTAFGPEPVPSEIILRLHDREISTNVQAPRQRHYCHPETKKIGLGDTTPFLEQTWQA